MYKGGRRSWETWGLHTAQIQRLSASGSEYWHMAARLAVYAFFYSVRKSCASARIYRWRTKFRFIYLCIARCPTRHPRMANFEVEVGILGIRGALYASGSRAFRRRSERAPKCGIYRTFFNRAVVGENTAPSNLRLPTACDVRARSRKYRMFLTPPSFPGA